MSRQGHTILIIKTTKSAISRLGKKAIGIINTNGQLLKSLWSFSMLTCNKYFRLRNFFCRNHHQGRIWCYFKNHLSSFLLFLTFLTLTWSILSMVKKFAYFKSFPSNYSPNDVQNRNAEWKLDKNIFIEWKIFQNSISFFLDYRFNRFFAQSKKFIKC